MFNVIRRNFEFRNQMVTRIKIIFSVVVALKRCKTEKIRLFYIISILGRIFRAKIRARRILASIESRDRSSIGRNATQEGLVFRGHRPPGCAHIS